MEYKVEGDYIELNKLLKLLNLVSSGGEANQLITERYVFVNREVETRKRRKCVPGDQVVFDEFEILLV